MRFEERPEGMREDYTSDFAGFHTPAEHGVWRTLFERQSKLLEGRACEAFLASLKTLKITGNEIPDIRHISDIIEKTTGFKLVTVHGLIPPEVFLEHLSKRQFPVTYWIRKPEQIDYLSEPDIFHDLFGHVPMLMNPVYADYMEEFGRGGTRAHKLNADKFIERLYWYTVEFGLIREKDGLRIYGSGIVSSKTESIYCLEDVRPHRIQLELKRAMRTDYRFDKLQECYFVIDSFEQLFDVTRPDFAPIYAEVRRAGDIEPYRVLSGDKLLHRGSVEKESH